ncbi:unnamed protein product [Caenorhabditis nigoni]
MSDSSPSPNGIVPEKFLQLREQRIRVHTDRLNGWLLLDVSNPEVIRDLEKITDENSLVEFEKKREIWAALQNVNFPAPEVRFAPKRTAFNINAVPFQPRISVIEAPRFVLPIVPKSYKLGTPEAAPIFSRIHEKKKESKVQIVVTLADDGCSSTSNEATEEPSMTETKEVGLENIDADSSSSCNEGDLTLQTSSGLAKIATIPTVSSSSDFARLQLKTSNSPAKNNKKSKAGKNKKKSGKKLKNDVVSSTFEKIEQPNINVDELTDEPAITDTKAVHEYVDLDEKERTAFDEVKSLSHEKAPNPEAITISLLPSGKDCEKKTTEPPNTHVLPPVDSAKLEKGTSSTLSSKLCDVLIANDNKVLAMPDGNGINSIDETAKRRQDIVRLDEKEQTCVDGSPSTLSLNPRGLLFLDENKIIPMTEENGNNSIQEKSESRQVIVVLDEEERTSLDKVESLPHEKTQCPQAIFKDDDFPVLSSGKKETYEPSPNHVYLPLGSGTSENQTPSTLSSRLAGDLPNQDKNKALPRTEKNSNNTKTATWAAVEIVPKLEGLLSLQNDLHPLLRRKHMPFLSLPPSTIHQRQKKFDEDGFEMVINGASTSEIAIKMERKIVIKKESPYSSTSSLSMPSSSEPSSATPSLSSSSSPQKKKKPSNQKKLKNVLKVTEDDLLAMELGIEENKKWEEKKKAEEEEKKMKEVEEAKTEEDLLKKLKKEEKKETPLNEENRETIPEKKAEVTAEEMKEYREELAMRVAVQAFEEQSIGQKEQQVIAKKVKGFCSSMKKLKGKKHSNPMVVPFDHREPKDVTNKRDIDNGNLLDIRIKYANKEGDRSNMFLAAVFGAFREYYSSEIGPTLTELFGKTDPETYMAREKLFIKTLSNDQGKMLKSVGY